MTRPAAGKADGSVTLGARLAKGGAFGSETFDITVLALPATVPTFTVDHDWTNFGSVAQPIVNAVLGSGSAIYVGTQSEGLLYSEDLGSTWQAKTAASGGLACDQVYSIAPRAQSFTSGPSMGSRNGIEAPT